MRVVAIVIAIVMLALALVYKFTSHAPSIPLNTNNATATSTNATLDSDKDGISDWEEQLFGSDPNDPNSVPSNETVTANGSTTATTLLAHTLLQQYLINTKGGTVSLSNPAALSTALANSVSVPTPTYHVYQLADIKTVANTDINRNQYQKSMQNTLAPMDQGSEAEIALYSKIITGDIAAEATLQGMVSTYTAVADAAAKISVPSEAALTHLNAVNALGYYSATLRELIAHKEDPVGSLVLLRAYNEAEQGMFNSFSALHRYIASHITTP